MKTIEIDERTYERIQTLLAEYDADSRIPRAFTETEIVAMAIIGLEYLTHSNPEAPIKAVVGVMVAKHEIE